MDKLSLFDSLREMLRAELRAAERVALETAAAANHPEARPENDKDTRKIELSYLAAGQAARARDLEASIALLSAVKLRPFAEDDPLEAGALVELDVAGKPQRVLLAPAGGGMKLAAGGEEVSVVTPQSPLGKGLLGKTVGDSFELAVGPQRKDVEIVSVE
jgi:hypothetical protein